ncbi:hypothetical protein SPRG_15050 [Saprolegnia parasitica CBS 223.65]|uniref:Uncharacterized protein n=1 Tax=Saprolegnia parasitica (strain CBS 223.65) TaxID=695850 RepID=A0A067BYN6_SAPPC|nr:hypothetical protein SPRG_15050 [Saprolegnia parasitica CBS 223.65]KDO19662.1 hypothetical protein SPRG_15050 [Saprolegnia parasitica CBS 223.65]|eukprot:XP_012209623.1 hypothetical protein SPRG_15050 [Saprolegnia parasitica CBS 223.65]
MVALPTWIVEALAEYRAVHGDCDVPPDFETPASQAEGSQPLGKVVKSVRESRSVHDDDDVNVLDSLGFNWTIKKKDSEGRCLGRCTARDNQGRKANKFVPWETLVEALEVFHGMMHSLEGMTDFHVVPRACEKNIWPMAARDVVLASIIPWLRSQFYVLDDDICLRVHDLELHTDLPRWSVLMAHLNAYRRIHGHCRVPIDFIVSPGTAGWPAEALELPLGVLAFKVGLQLTSLSDSKRTDLASVRFEFNTIDTWRNVLDALLVHRQLHGTVSVRQGFFVPCDKGYPPSLWHRRLIFWVKRLFEARRLCLLTADTVSALEYIETGPAAGAFDALATMPGSPDTSASTDGLWHLVEWALWVYNYTHDDLDIPADYVVPDVPTTPTLLRGFRLGAAYAQLHQQSTMSPSRRQRFEMNFGITFTAPDTDL